MPTKPRKKSDRRVLDLEHTVEAEALPAHIMRRLLRNKVESFLPTYALAVTRAVEQSERSTLFELVEAVQ